MGYAFWLLDSFNLVVGSDLHFASFGGDDDGLTAGWFNLTHVGCVWY